MYVYAAERVQTPLQAQAVALNSLWLGWTLYAFFLHELAFFALRRGESVQSAAQPTQRGALWLAALWLSMGALAPLIVRSASGTSIEPARWGMVLLALGGWCAWAGSLCYSAMPLQNDALNRYILPAMRHVTIGTALVGGLVWGVLAAQWLSGVIPIPWLSPAVHGLLHLAPTYWVFLPDAPLWVYGVYALYNSMLAVFTVRSRIRQAHATA